MRLSEAKNSVLALPKAIEKPIIVDGKQEDNFKAIQFDTNNTTIAVFKKQYSVIQHSDLFREVIDNLTAIGLKGDAKIITSPNKARAHMYIMFDDKIIKDDEKGIKYGLKITNSYDGSSSIRFEFYGFRIACMNQMVLRNLLSKTIIIHNYLDRKDIQETIQKTITKLINSHDAFQELVSQAITETFEWELLQEIIKNMLQRELSYKHLTKIFNKVGITIIKKDDNIQFVKEKNATLNKWKIYNAFTEYLTHETGLTYNLQQWLELLSEKILLAPVTVQH